MLDSLGSWFPHSCDYIYNAELLTIKKCQSDFPSLTPLPLSLSKLNLVVSVILLKQILMGRMRQTQTTL